MSVSGVDLFKKKTKSCGTRYLFPRMTNSIAQPFGSTRLAIFLLIFWIAACQVRGSKEQDVAGTDVSKEPIPAQPAMPETSDVDEKNILYPGQSLWAGGYGLVLDGDQTGFGARLTENGEFILYNASGRLWTAKTKNAVPGYELIMQDDGNLVLYDDRFRPVWASETHGYFGGEKYRTADWKPVKLVLEPNLLVLYSVTGRRVWSHQEGEIGDPK